MSMYKYTVAICNYNMGDTLERSISSVANQLDSDYEILIVDDGSKDDSVEIIRRLQKKFNNINAVYLKRKWKRQLGETRNISVELASGKYVILHVDADDYWEPHIKSFVKIFHLIEKHLKSDFMLQGQQINIAKKNFLIKKGPYRNLQRAQDRDLWQRLAFTSELIYLDHKIFRKRLKRPQKVFYIKALHDLWFHILFDLRKNNFLGRLNLFKIYFYDFFRKKNVSLVIKLIRFIILPFVFVSSFFYETLYSKKMMPGKDMPEYRKNFGNLEEIAKKLNIKFKKNIIHKKSYEYFYESK